MEFDDYTVGILDSSARIYEHAVIITVPEPQLREAIRKTTGGTVVKNRIDIRGRCQRRDLLSAWHPASRYRDAEIAEALDLLPAEGAWGRS